MLSPTNFCCCSFLKFYREHVTAEAIPNFFCPFFFSLLLCTAREMLQLSFDSLQMQSIQRISISTSRPMSLLQLRILVARVRDLICFPDDGDHGFLLKWVDKGHEVLHVLEAFPICYRVDEHQSVGPIRPISDILLSNRLGQKEEIQVKIKFRAVKNRISVSLN